MARKLKVARRIAFASVATLLFTAPFSVVSAETLEEAYSDAVTTSPELAARRARLRAQRQALPLALSEALPQIQLTATASRVFRDDPAQRQTGSEKREEWRGSASGSQLVFGSGRVWASSRQARAQIQSGEALYWEAAQSLLFETAQVYADLRQARAVLAAQQKTLENLVEQRRYVEANQRAGFLTVTDLAQADARIAASEGQLARARAGETSAAQAFLRLVGRPPGDLGSPEPVEGLPQSLAEALARAADTRMIVEAARQAERAADAAVDVAAANGRPRLTFEADSAIDNEFNGAEGDRFIDDLVGFRLSIPFSAGGANWARARQQRALREAARLEIAITLRDIEQGVTSAWANLEAARIVLVSSHEEVRSAELALRGVGREQQAGLRAVIDVLDQEQALLAANLSRARAERDVAVAERQLMFETGSISCRECEIPDARAKDRKPAKG